jgi:VWFA-related protein
VKTLAAVLGVAVLYSLPAQSPQADKSQPKTTFKSTIDLVPVDVNVVDKDGRPVGDLTAADFVLMVDGKPRTIASAEFIAMTRDSVPADPPPSNYSSNSASAGGRLIMIVIDQGNIGASRGKYAADAASRFVSRLNKADRVGLQTIPGAGPQVGFTSNHALVQTMLQKIVGQAPSDHGSTKVGLAEALALERGNEQIIAELVDRECPGFRTAEEVAICRSQLAVEARAMFADTKSRTRDSLLSLRHVMERLAQTTNPKTVVFVSEGILIDREVSEISWLGPLAARGQVTLYVFQLDQPQFDAAGSRVSPSRSADIDLAHEGLGLIAGLARGSVFRVVNKADYAFNRLALELSGYYLLSFEPESGDRDGKTHKIRIDVPARRNLEVRSRREFAVDSARVQTDEEMLAETLRAPLLANEVGVKVTTYTFREPEGSKLKIVVATEIDRSLNPAGKVALAYALMDERGGLVGSQVEPEVKTPVTSSQTQTYFGAIAADPGNYTLKLAVVDDRGKRGSVEHTFRAQLTAAGQIRVTDLLIAEVGSAGVKGLIPAVSADFTGDILQAYVELYSDAAEPLRSATAVIEIAQHEQGRELDSAIARFQPDSGPAELRRVAEGSVPIALLPPGNYVARVVISAGGRKLGQVTRPFRIVRRFPTLTAPGASASRAPGTAAPIPFASSIETFDRSSALRPAVVGFFLDRMNVGNRVGNASIPALDAARAGQFDRAAEAMKGMAPVASVFVSGLALYAKGDLEGAAGKFRESLRLESEFFPAAFYLGACYAASGRDREAAGVWQTSLITQSDAPFIFTLLGDAFLRLRDNDQAVDILVEASRLWPASDDVQMRLGIAQAAAGKAADAIATLDRYLAKHPDDHRTLMVAMQTIYETRSAGKAIGTAAEDRERFNRYAATYAAAGGPPQPQIEEWKRFIDR